MLLVQHSILPFAAQQKIQIIKKKITKIEPKVFSYRSFIVLCVCETKVHTTNSTTDREVKETISIPSVSV